MAKTFNIAVMPGDGTGPEVIAEGVKVLNAAASKSGIKLNYNYYDFGGERYLRTGETLPDSAVKELKSHDAIYLGAMGHPDVKPGILEKDILLKLRFEFDQYINLRPVKLYKGVETPIKNKTHEDIDFVVVRENSAGLYTGQGGISKKGSSDEVATQLMIYTRHEVERCIRYAFEYTKKRNKKNCLALAHKTNVLTYVGDLWMRVFEEVGKKDYPGIKRRYENVDATTMWFVETPENYDVLVTSNMFGDIITDLAAVIQGGIGTAPGGNINPEGLSMFEPIGGSAPSHTGKNVINPIAAIAAGQMMLDFLGAKEAADSIENALEKSLASGKIKGMAACKMGMGTTEVGDLIASLL
ncbi:MAG: 3-isopropylmalate dehydrogenase [Oligoflexia bacterium]|nr:3-isopropylmalate dehydrogenase [Oligoflexia bacterium]